MISTDKSRVLRADLILLLVAAIWGLGIPLTADIVRAFSPLWGGALRMVIAGIAIVVLFPSCVRNATKNDWKYGCMIAFIVTCIFICMSFALVFSTASKQSFFIGTSVLMVPFLAWAVNHKRPHLLIFCGAGLATLGMAVMGFTPGMRFNSGDSFNLVMAVFCAFQVITIDYAVKRMENPTTLVVLQLPLVGIALTIAAFVVEGIPDLASVTSMTWAQIAFTGLVNTVLCFVIQTRAQKQTSASHAAIILSLESFFGYAIAVLIGQDPFYTQGAVGGALILAGVMLSELETILIHNRREMHE